MQSGEAPDALPDKLSNPPDMVKRDLHESRDWMGFEASRLQRPLGGGVLSLLLSLVSARLTLSLIAVRCSVDMGVSPS